MGDQTFHILPLSSFISPFPHPMLFVTLTVANHSCLTFHSGKGIKKLANGDIYDGEWSFLIKPMEKEQNALHVEMSIVGGIRRMRHKYGFYTWVMEIRLRETGRTAR